MSHSQFLSACYALYNEANPLHPGYWPKVNQCEAEVVSMCAKLLHCTTATAGCVTSGGTESILLAIRGNARYFGQHVAHPELIAASSAHAAVRKACDLYGMRLVEVDVNDGRSFQLTAKQVRPYITANTVLIYASAPCYPQGVIDDIVGLGALAERHNIGLHVDACLGGFVLPFLKHPPPPFDFGASNGVTSMSIDTHKYGYAAKGSSVVLYSDPKIRHAQYFSYADWSGGLYATPTLAGSRPGALSVAAWASLVSMGQSGCQEAVDKISRAVAIMAKGVESISGVKLLGQQQYLMVCIGADEREGLDIYRIKDAMSQFGWSLNDLQNPASIHLCVTLQVVPQAQAFVQDLRQSVEAVRKEGTSKTMKGTAGIYGAVGSAPSGSVEHLLNIYTDETLAL